MEISRHDIARVCRTVLQVGEGACANGLSLFDAVARFPGRREP
jgi:hypothetical protein